MFCIIQEGCKMDLNFFSFFAFIGFIEVNIYLGILLSGVTRFIFKLCRKVIHAIRIRKACKK